MGWIHNIRITYSEKMQRIWFSGVDYGNRAKLVARNKQFLVINIPGQTFASGQQRPYAPAQNVVFKINNEYSSHNDECVTFECEEAIAWERTKKEK